MTDWVIELVGGPEDGRIQETRELPHDFRVPMLSSSMTDWLASDPLTIPMPNLQVGSYRLRINEYGRHSMTDEGHVLFDWKGVR